MKNGRMVAFAFLVATAGCAEEPEDADATSTTAGTAGTDGMMGHDMGNMTGEEVEMYAVATDLSSTPTTWYRFRPDTFEAKVGSMLNITLKQAVGNQNGHSLVIDELDVNIAAPATPGTGETASTVIALTKAGTYTFYCAEGNHQELGMQGTLTVS